MSTEEENYLDNLLKSLTEPPKSEVLEETTEDTTEAIATPEIEEINMDDLPDVEEPVVMEELPDLEEPVAIEELPDLEEPVAIEELPDLEEPVAIEELPDLEEPVAIEELPDVEEPVVMEELPDLEEPVAIEELPDLEEPVAIEELPDLEEPVAIEELPDLEEPVAIEELPDLEESVMEETIVEESVVEEPVVEESVVEATEEVNLEDIPIKEVAIEETPIEEIPIEETQSEDISLEEAVLEEALMAEEPTIAQSAEVDEFNLDDLGLADVDLSNIDLDNVSLDLDDADFAGLASAVDMPDEVEEALQEETSVMEEPLATEEPLNMEELPELDTAPELDELPELNTIPELDTLPDFDEVTPDEEALPVETMEVSTGDASSEDSVLNISEEDLDLDGLGDMAAVEEMTNLDDLMPDETGAEDDDISDVLNLLDDDSDMAEIGSLLTKADGSASADDDDMMAMLSQMADTEAEKINASDQAQVTQPESTGAEDVAVVAEKVTKKKGRKVFKPEVDVNATIEQKPKKPGLFSKLFNTLTEEWEPEPTEEELKAEAEQKAFEKQAAKEKKEEEKAAKAEEKKQKAEEAAALKKAKKEEADKAKQAKKEAKEAKRAAEEEEEAKKGGKKRISKKKYAVVTIMAASILGGILLATELLSSYANRMDGRKAFYAGNYKDTYLEMYGEELDESDALLQARSKVIMKMQRKLDSYENYMKIGYELQAVHALLEGLVVYDHVNLEAEQYQVADEVADLRADILMILHSNYGLSEEAARELLQNEDEISYTKALNHIIMGTDSELVANDME